MLACLALSLLFFAHEAKAEALGLNTVKTAVINQVRQDDSAARTLQNAISYKSPSWEKVLQPQLAQREEQIKVENERLAKEKAEAEAKARQAAVVVTPVVIKPAPIVQPVVSGSCRDWMIAAGVTDLVNAAELIRRESGCNPTATNRSSGAFGIPQSLPASKIAHCGVDPVCQIQWMQNYVNARYGGWAQAVAFHNRMNWY